MSKYLEVTTQKISNCIQLNLILGGYFNILKGTVALAM